MTWRVRSPASVVQTTVSFSDNPVLREVGSAEAEVLPAEFLSGTILIGSAEPPALTAQPQSQSIAAGSDAIFEVAASGAEPLAYQWQFNNDLLQDNSRVSGARSNRLTIARTVTGDAGTYRVVVTNAFGSATSQVATLTVGMSAPLRLELTADGRLELTITSSVGSVYRIERASDLSQEPWILLTTLVITTPTQTFVDSEPVTANQRRFYRVTPVP